MSGNITASPFARESGVLRRNILTPEGVTIPIEVASVTDRFAALLIDLVIVFGLSLVLVLSMVIVYGVVGRAGWPLYCAAYITWFLVWNFYFILFETRWQGRTPGKRLLGIRVIEGSGGPLSLEAVCVRNFIRRFELELPIFMMCFPLWFWPSAPGWLQLIAVLWMLVLMLLPAFHPQRLRLGDIVAGTLVVSAPKTLLLRDLTASELESAERGKSDGGQERAPKPEPPRFEFTQEQLDLYGEYELQVLEKLLRAPSLPSEMVELVFAKITKKIGWEESVPSAARADFLREFYRAQRARLEHKLLFGQRQEFKKPGTLREGK